MARLKWSQHTDASAAQKEKEPDAPGPFFTGHAPFSEGLALSVVGVFHATRHCPTNPRPAICLRRPAERVARFYGKDTAAVNSVQSLFRLKSRLRGMPKTGQTTSAGFSAEVNGAHHAPT